MVWIKGGGLTATDDRNWGKSCSGLSQALLFVSIFVLSLVKLPYGPGDKKHLMFQDVTG
jgi:hypothetical protein